MANTEGYGYLNGGAETASMGRASSGTFDGHHQEPSRRPRPAPLTPGMFRNLVKKDPSARPWLRRGAREAHRWFPRAPENTQAVGYRLQATGYRLQATAYRLEAVGRKLQATGYRLQAVGYRLQATGRRL